MSTVKVIKATLRANGGGPIGEGRRGPTHFSVELLLDRIPSRDEYRYKTHKVGGNTWYIGLVDGIANFFCHSPRDERGYGGRVFTGTLEDGSAFSVRGPWSSGPSEINSFNLICTVVEASATTNEEDFERGYTFYSLSGVTLDIIKQAEKLLPGWVYNYTPHIRHPASIGASEEQTRAIEMPDGPKSGWIYYKDFEPCPTCNGISYVEARPNEPRAWYSERTKRWTKVCPTCGNGCDAGIVPVPGMRRFHRGAMTAPLV